MKSKIIVNTNKNCIIKKCRSVKELNNEKYIYLKNLSFIPKFISSKDPRTIEIEFIQGTTIIDMEKPDFFQLGKLLGNLHNIENKNEKVICHYDNNPKNYLYNNQINKYYIIDFSEWKYDYPETDLIHFLLFWASIYNFQRFKKCVSDFIQGYSIEKINKSEWNTYLQNQIERFDNRRKLYKVKNEITEAILKNRNYLISEQLFSNQ